MSDYNPDHYRFRRSGNLEDDPRYRKRLRHSAIIDVAVFWFVIIFIGVTIWWFY